MINNGGGACDCLHGFAWIHIEKHTWGKKIYIHTQSDVGSHRKG